MQTFPLTASDAAGGGPHNRFEVLMRTVRERLGLASPAVREIASNDAEEPERGADGREIQIPLHFGEDVRFDTSCRFTGRSDGPLDDYDMNDMRAFAHLTGQYIQERIDHSRARNDRRTAIRDIIARKAIEMVFQPVIRIDRPKVEFVEALARFPTCRPSAPIGWFNDAFDVGLGIELEVLAFDSAMAQIAGLPNTTALSINVSPDTLLSPAMQERLAAAPARRLIIEVTEHRPVTNYVTLGEALRPFRKRGLRLAVDDAGAGYANLRHILDLQPDIIKLDMSLSRGIDRDPARRALAAALIQFAAAVDAELVAEGVESPAELAALRSLGIAMVQGHIYARPAAMGTLGGDSLAA
ncbi:EAL domain-containing protein [Sphingomonas mesophila]|uniref:EAL domain-containing protein n=1 Tax=Sphingomonas mesophila TaxID=2303576 RepID=UPI0013C302A4|nr:EAL domain-containing protein [Sphingomonas mesophila]